MCRDPSLGKDTARTVPPALLGAPLRHHRAVAATLHRYWITLADPAGGSRLGYGVTAYDEADARSILAYLAFGGELPELAEVRADVDVRDLDQGHVIPNMNPPNWRGVWYPKGFDRELH
jgi:hypothetical protein